MELFSSVKKIFNQKLIEPLKDFFSEETSIPLRQEKISKEIDVLVSLEEKKNLIDSLKYLYKNPFDTWELEVKNNNIQVVDIKSVGENKTPLSYASYLEGRMKKGVESSTLVEKYNKTQRKREEKLLGFIKESIKGYSKNKDFKSIFSSYDRLALSINRESFKQFEEEIKFYKNEELNYINQISEKIVDLKNKKTDLDPLQYQNTLYVFFNSAKHFPEQFSDELEFLKKEFELLTNQKELYSSQYNQLQTKIALQKFEKASKILVDIRNHPFNTPVFLYEEKWKKKQQEIATQKESFINSHLIGFDKKFRNDLDGGLNFIFNLKNMIGFSQVLEDKQNEIVEEQRKEKERKENVLKQTGNLINNVRYLIKSKKFKEALYKINSFSDLKDALPRQKSIIENLILNLEESIEQEKQEEIEINAFISKLKRKLLIKSPTRITFVKGFDLIESLNNHKFYHIYEETIVKLEKQFQQCYQNFKKDKWLLAIKKYEVAISNQDFESAKNIIQKAKEFKPSKIKIQDYIDQATSLESKYKLKLLEQQKQKYIKLCEQIKREINISRFSTKGEFQYFQSRFEEINKLWKEYNAMSSRRILNKRLNSLQNLSIQKRGRFLDEIFNPKNETTAREIIREGLDIGYYNNEDVQLLNQRINQAKIVYKFPKVSFLDIYYPPKHNVEDPEERHDKFRRMVWKFKDGYSAPSLNSRIVNLIKDRISLTENSVFCVAPASTSEKNKKRFQSFCRKVSSILNIQNGFDYIYLTEDREQGKGLKNRNILDNIDFDNQQLRGKDVIMFDDISTHGDTFYQITKELERIGVRNISWVFIGLTNNAHMYNKYS